jgi:hypothetical protein
MEPMMVSLIITAKYQEYAEPKPEKPDWMMNNLFTCLGNILIFL